MKTSKITQQNRDSLLLAGTQKHYGTTPSLSFGGSTHTPAEIAQALQSRITATKTTDTTRTAFHSAVQAERDERAKSSTLVKQYKAFVLAAFGQDLTMLAEFGLSPRRQATIAPGTQVAAANKAKATRTARHTLGPKQKSLIKGAPAPSPVKPI